VALAVTATALCSLVLGFLILPVAALLTYQPIPALVEGFGADIATEAVLVSLKTNVIALALILGLGTPFAFILARLRFPGRPVVITLVELPLVTPPAVAGLGLLVAYGRAGLLGGSLATLGIEIAFSQLAVIIALLFVAGPFYLRGAIAAYEAVDENLLDVASTLGAGPLRRMVNIATPLAAGGLGAAAAVAFARGIGEFGATILFAGSLRGTTQTLPLAVYSLFEVNLDQAIAIGVLLILVSAAVLLTSKLLIARWAHSKSISPSGAELSLSSPS